MSAYATANGVPINSLRIHLPRHGAWHGDVVVHDDSLLNTSILLDINGVQFSAQGFRVSVLEGAGVAAFIGGAGGLGAPVQAQHYTNVPVSTVLNDILKAGGETLSPTADASVTGMQLNHWTVMAGRVGQALQALASEADAIWRVLIDGTVWMGQEPWPTQKVDCEVLLEDVIADRAVLYMEKPELVPGTIFHGRHVSYVEHELRPDGILRTYAWFERDPP